VRAQVEELLPAAGIRPRIDGPAKAAAFVRLKKAEG
jgi:hypothetical protein